MKVTAQPPLQHEQKTLLENFCRTSPLDSEVDELAERMAHCDSVTFTKKRVQHICTRRELMSPASALLKHFLQMLQGQRTDQGATT